jgi:hypothetical protein
MNFRKKLGIIILASALVVAGILLFYPYTKPATKNSADKNLAGKAEPFQLEKSEEKLGVISADELSEFINNQKPTKNLTQQLAENLAQGFMAQNPNGIDAQGGLSTPDSESLLEESVINAAAEFQLENEFVELKDLNISSNNSKENIAEYISQYYSILGNYTNKMRLADNLQAFSESQDVNYIIPLLGYFDKLILEMKKLAVPSSFVLLHQQEINLLIGEKSLLAALIDFPNDSLRAAAALKIFPDLEKQFADLDNLIENQLKTYGFVVFRK